MCDPGNSGVGRRDEANSMVTLHLQAGRHPAEELAWLAVFVQYTTTPTRVDRR